MTLTLTPAGRARFLSWLQDVGRSTLRPDAVESEMLQIMEDRAESGESLSYELGGQYTTSGRPELFYATAADFDQDDDGADGKQNEEPKIVHTEIGKVQILHEPLTTLRDDKYQECGSTLLVRRLPVVAPGSADKGGCDIMWVWGGDYTGFLDSMQHDAEQLEAWMPPALEEAIEEAIRVEPACATDMDWYRAWARNARAALQALDDDADQEHIISAILGEDAIELSFDPVRPESPVFYRYPEVSDDWQSCPFQSADVRHLSDEAACAMVNNWVG
jgi:hypothetical protein